MLTRRELFRISGAAALVPFLPGILQPKPDPTDHFFRYCLNTSTISGQKSGLIHSIEIAAKAGYDGIELWVNDIQEYLIQKNSLDSLDKFLRSKNLRVENLISFTEWMVDDDTRRSTALRQLEAEMKMANAIGCRRIAAPPAGISMGEPIDFQKAGSRYREILRLGRKYNVTPLLEFWGASGTLYNLGQAMAIAAAANDPDAKILPDIYHLFRGGSGFDSLKLLGGHAIDIVHVNDYPGTKKVDEQTDADRVYPGDGIAPLKQVLRDLRTMGGVKILSLELFNREYWTHDPLEVARTGLQKMKALGM